MEAAKTLLRTVARTIHKDNPKKIVIIDALLIHSVLHIEDLAFILHSQPKEVRALIAPLRSDRLLAAHSRLEVRAGSNRGSPREYYYIPFHPAIDAIKYRMAKLRRKVESLYQQDDTRTKDWQCPRCKAEYEELEILDKLGDDGFYCERCHTTLRQNEAAAQDKGDHAKIRRLNEQLARFDVLLAKIDQAEIPRNDFQSAWERKKDVPRDKNTGYSNNQAEYVELKRDDRNGGKTMVKKQETVDSKNLNISLTNNAVREKELEQEREKRKAELAKQNMMPVWHAKSAIGLAAGESSSSVIKTEVDGEPVKSEDYDMEEKKLNVEEDKMRDEVAAYMAEMERERMESERKEQEEIDEEDEGDDFEDVDFVGTPMSSSQLAAPNSKSGSNSKPNNLKREAGDGGSSGVSSEANTPAAIVGGGSIGGVERDVKRVKFENGTSIAGSATTIVKGEDADSDEDEDFEDAM